MAFTHTHTHTHTHQPGVEEGTVEQRPVVVVAHKVSGLRLPGARLGHVLVGHRDAVPGVVEIQQHHVKHQRRLPRDVTTCRGGGGSQGAREGVEGGEGGMKERKKKNDVIEGVIRKHSLKLASCSLSVLCNDSLALFRFHF